MSSRDTRDISLTSEWEMFIAEQVRSGKFTNAGAVVTAGLGALRDGEMAVPLAAGWPIGGGVCGALVRELDWAKTPLGAMDSWSAELRTTVANVVNSPVAKVLMWGPDHVMIYNDGYAQIVGTKHPMALGATVGDVWPEIWDWNSEILTAGFRGERLAYRDQPIVLIRGNALETVMFDLFYTPVYEARGNVGGVLCTCVDNSALVEAERRLASSELELRTITDALPVLISFVDRDHRFRFANRSCLDWFGLAPEDIVGRHARDVIGDTNYLQHLPFMERALAGETIEADTMIVRTDGTRCHVSARYLPRLDADGRVTGFQLLVIDLEERVQREQELRVSNGRFRAAMDAVHGVLWTNSAEGQMVGEQPGWAALTGQRFEDYSGFGWADAVHPEDRGASVASWNEAVAAKSTYVHEHRVRHHDGSWRSFSVRALPLFGDAGVIIEWVGVHTDITHQRAAEAALRQQAEALSGQVRHRERAEEQLRHLNETLETRVIAEIAERRHAEAKLAQAQKLETVGKLTGGVAHDFNNLLQVVGGNLQLLGKDIAGNPRAEQRVINAMAGVSRGAKLASQLLAFGRRQALEPRVVNLTRFVRDMDDMFRRAIGEGIEIETVVGGGLWNTYIDPGHVENALLNLAINARDAMDGHGKLTIELGNAYLDADYARSHDEVTPGQYVMLAVTDTGTGIPPDVLERVFEPFFSTKGEGKGSGLGLSMVYGFVKQSAGHIKIYSEPGEGTTVRLYLPRAMQSEDVEVKMDNGPVSGGTETVLVVEDDAEVRATVVDLLTDLGYRVLKAADATAALIVIESGVPIDILFTDVVMPGPLKSPELARKARQRLPNLAILFTSGYTENSIVHGGKLDAGVELLSKPYTRDALARRFRHVLGNQQQRNSGHEPQTVGAEVRPGEAEAPALGGTKVLLVEDDVLIRINTADMLQEAGCIVIEAGTAEEAIAVMQTEAVDVLVTDLNLPGSSGLALADHARSLYGATGVVFATGDGQRALGSAAQGDVVLAKPYDARRLTAALIDALGSKGTTAAGAYRDRNPDDREPST